MAKKKTSIIGVKITGHKAIEGKSSADILALVKDLEGHVEKIRELGFTIDFAWSPATMLLEPSSGS